MKHEIRSIVMTSVSAIALLLFVTACGGEQSVASKSAQAFRDARQKGLPIGGDGHGDHGTSGGHHGSAETSSADDHITMTGMDHSSMPGMDHGATQAGGPGMAGMDHSQMSTGEQSAMRGMDHSRMQQGTAQQHDRGMGGMDHGNMPGMQHRTPQQKQGMAGMNHSAMPGIQHGTAQQRDRGMAGMDHGNMPGMQHGTPQQKQGMAGMDHSAMPGMQHGTAQQQDRGLAGMDHSNMAGMQHGTMSAGAPQVADAPNTSSEMTALRPSATLEVDRFDAPVPISVAEAAKAAAGMAHTGPNTVHTVPGEDQANPPAPRPAGHEGHGEPATPTPQPRLPRAAEPPASSAPAATTLYTCPMHPEVTSRTPGTCPKCGMALIEKK